MEKKAQNPDEDDEDEDDEDDELQFVDITPAPVEITAKQEIRLQVTERTKRKRVTTVDGVDSFGINEKELGKLIAKKFATSCGSGETGLIVNGDLIYDIAEFIIEKYPQVPEKAFIKIEKGGIRKKLF
jgi:density-regulated protein DRP1